ncbi:DUF3618 domain-containing protein [Mycobacterium sp. URHB0021]
MTTDQNPTSPQPGPDAGIDDNQTDIEKIRTELGETVGALPGTADVGNEIKQTVTDVKDPLTETANETADAVVETADAVVETADAAQSAARGAFTNMTRSVKPGIPIAALIAAGVAISVVAWRRR